MISEASMILLGHLKIGQATSTLSGGENVRIKILKSSSNTKKVLGIDEPFKGLSIIKIDTLIKYFCRLINSGKTLILVDHSEEAFEYFPTIIELKEHERKLIGIATRK